MEIINQNLGYVKEEVDKVLSTSPLIIRRYTKHLAQAQGKYIRALSVLSAAVQEDMSISHDAVLFASSIEILHLASLVHDDVMDEADTRRGIVTLHKEYGRKTAIICGDYLLAVAMNLMNRVEDKNQYVDYDLSTYMVELSLGELNQHLNNGNSKLSVKEYLEIINGKTAALFEASFYAGAITSGENETSFESYKKLGHNIGMIFQLIDDCIDFEVSENAAKKPVQSDFEQGVFTLPLILSIEASGTEFMAKTRDEVNKLVSKFNGVEKTKKRAQSYYDESLAIVNEMSVDEDKKSSLISILNLSMGYAL